MATEGPVYTGYSRLFSRNGKDISVSIWQGDGGFYPMVGYDGGRGTEMRPMVDSEFSDVEETASFSDQAMADEGFRPCDRWDDNFLMGKKEKPSAKGRTREEAKFIDEVVHAIQGPIIVYSEEWGKSLPDMIKKDVTMARLLKLLKDKEPGMATDLEVVAYMFSRSMVAPMGHNWTEIYLYASGKYLRERGTKPPPNTPEKLTQDQERMYNDLKRWLFERYEKVKRRTGGFIEAQAPELKASA